MNVKDTVLRQYRGIVNHAARKTGTVSMPREGWLRTVRKALGMSGPELANRLKTTRQRISQIEEAERSGNLTLETMQDAAKAMGCRFVYAIIPERGTIQDIIKMQARKKAEALVARASGHMALEDQALSKDATRAEIERVAEDLARIMPSDFWRGP